MHCSKFNHHIEGKHSRCPECNIPNNQNVKSPENSKNSLVNCHNCGTSNETERSRCCSCNIALQTEGATKKKARTFDLYPKVDRLLDKGMFAPYQLNGIQISKS